MFNEIQRKRKSDICQSLGDSFKPYAKSDRSEDYLWKKRMNQDLKTIHDKSRSRKFYQSSKN